MRHSWDPQHLLPEPASPNPTTSELAGPPYGPSNPIAAPHQPSIPDPLELDGHQQTGISITNLPPLWGRKHWQLNNNQLAGRGGADGPAAALGGDLRKTGLSIASAPNRHAWDLESLLGGSPRGSVDSSCYDEPVLVRQRLGPLQPASGLLLAHRPEAARLSAGELGERDLDHRWLPLFLSEGSLQRYLDPPQRGEALQARQLVERVVNSPPVATAYADCMPKEGAAAPAEAGNFEPQLDDLARLLTLYGRRPAGVGRKDLALYEPPAPPPPAKL